MTGASTTHRRSLPRMVAALLFATVCGAALVSLAFWIVAEDFHRFHRRERFTFLLAGAIGGLTCGMFTLFEDRVLGRLRPFLGGLITYYLGVAVSWMFVLVSDGESSLRGILDQDFGEAMLDLFFDSVAVVFLASVPIGIFAIPLTFGLRRVVRRIAGHSERASGTMSA